ncbi:MAG TPA: HAD family hydrolase [Caulobacteraceae bacterium]|nr:HAD family hydrolase [Caulobacteraceae bacterium]
MSGISLLVSDVDGTLVTPDKQVTAASVAASAKLKAAGIALCLVSSRPPRGMASVLAAVANDQPFAAFNGGVICSADGALLDRCALDRAVIERTLSALAAEAIEAWVFDGDDWLIADPHGPKIARERMTVGFDPIVVTDLAARCDAVGKIVGVSDDHARLAAFGERFAPEVAGRASVGLSQPYYLDITPPAADKGRAVSRLCHLTGVPPERTAVIGDMWNDVAMFDVAAVAIAMGQAPDGVKARAAQVALSNTQDGWAQAVEAFVLPHAQARRGR